MKRIGIDARLYFQTGVGVYLRNFLHFLQQNSPDNIEFYIYVLKKDSSQILLSSPQFVKREVNSHWHSISEQTAFLSELQADSLDLMHFTYFSYPVLYRKKFIATVHDITPLIHKTGRASTLNPLLYELKYQSYKFVLKQQIKNASLIVTPTKTVKKQITEVYGEQFSNKIKPIYEGVNYELLHAKENTSLKYQFQKPFFLYIGNFYPHKNVETLLSAFKEISSDVELVLVGPDNYFSSRVQNEMKQQNITNIRFYHTGVNEDLVFFYKNAVALINPSISEGFGLPLIEAAHFNLPIIASDLEVFHELLGDKFVAFNPFSKHELKEKINELLKKKMKLNTKDITESFSFKKMTNEILKEYSRLL